MSKKKYVCFYPSAARYVDKPWKLSKFEKNLIIRFDFFCRKCWSFDVFPQFCVIYGSNRFIRVLFEIWLRDTINQEDTSANAQVSKANERLIHNVNFAIRIPIVYTAPFSADFDDCGPHPFYFLGVNSLSECED
jgi:hypothetical protein